MEQWIGLGVLSAERVNGQPVWSRVSGRTYLTADRGDVLPSFCRQPAVQLYQ